MSIEILLQDADIVSFVATTDIGTYLYRYFPRKNKYFALYKKQWLEVDEGEAGVIEYHAYRQQFLTTDS